MEAKYKERWREENAPMAGGASQASAATSPGVPTEAAQRTYADWLRRRRRQAGAKDPPSQEERERARAVTEDWKALLGEANKLRPLYVPADAVEARPRYYLLIANAAEEAERPRVSTAALEELREDRGVAPYETPPSGVIKITRLNAGAVLKSAVKGFLAGVDALGACFRGTPFADVCRNWITRAQQWAARQYAGLAEHAHALSHPVSKEEWGTCLSGGAAPDRVIEILTSGVRALLVQPRQLEALLAPLQPGVWAARVQGALAGVVNPLAKKRHRAQHRRRAGRGKLSRSKAAPAPPLEDPIDADVLGDVPTAAAAEERKRRARLVDDARAALKDVTTQRRGYAGLPWAKLQYLVQQQKAAEYPGYWMNPAEGPDEAALRQAAADLREVQRIKDTRLWSQRSREFAAKVEAAAATRDRDAELWAAWRKLAQMKKNAAALRAHADAPDAPLEVSTVPALTPPEAAAVRS